MTVINKGLIKLRAAIPTMDEGLIFARYLDEAAEGFFRFMLGSNAEQIIAKAYAQPNHDLSYQNVTFAEYNKCIIGMVSGYTAEQHKRSSLQTLKKAAGRNNIRMRIVLVLFTPLMRIMDTISDFDFYIQAIAVDKKVHGTGVGSILMDSFEEKARAIGSTRMALDVSSKNESACRFYEHRGMAIMSQWPKYLPIPGIRLYRLTKTL